MTKTISLYYQFETKRNHLVCPQYDALTALNDWERISQPGI
ncbi:MAG: hypothetical protein WAM44_09680 [Chthoniobacterales bacterium]